MLLNFTVGNFRSIKEPITFSMEAAAIHEHDDTNVFTADKRRILKTSVIYGANASGKSNLVKAAAFMRYCVISMGFELKPDEEISIIPFRLCKDSENSPSIFEVEFVEEDKKYRYGFSLDKKKIHSEWLFLTQGKEFPLFIRENEKLTTISPQFKEGKTWQSMTKKTGLVLRRNSLLITSLGQLFQGDGNKELHSFNVRNWFTKFLTISGLSDDFARTFTLDLITRLATDKIQNLLSAFDLGIPRIEETQVRVNDENGSVEYEIKTKHTNDKGESVLFDLDSDESAGTQKIFSISGLLLQVLRDGGVLLFDEFDARLHPLLSWKIIELFHQLNKKGAQLIAISHDTNLLNPQLLRRDQIWFTEKDKDNSTRLTSLAEFKKIRKGESYEKNYIDGRYGAIPYLGTLNFGEIEK